MAMVNAGLANNNAFSNQAQNQNFYDRPSSSASSHSQQQQSSSSRQPSSSTSHQMMPPPPPRPPTAQGGHSSRPNTSQARSPTIPGSQQAQMLEMMQQGPQRSQSRMVTILSAIMTCSYSRSTKGSSK
jgi:SWI/SNF-related matrix-associated actin-dependent regulator of chromatin subfamily B protein 1